MHLVAWVSKSVSSALFLEGLSKILATAPGFSFLALLMSNWKTIDGPISKQSASKWSLQSAKYFVPVHSACVLWTCLVHWAQRTGSFGNVNRLTPWPYVLQQPAARACFIMVTTNVCVLTRTSTSVLPMTSYKATPKIGNKWPEAKVQGLSIF